MQLIRGLKNLKKHNGCVVAIGNFDGVHVGHQKIVKILVNKAANMCLPAVIISFVPAPQYFFGKLEAVLTSYKEKYKLFKQLGVDKNLIIHFNKQFSQLTPENFIQQILIDKLNIKYCLIGDDFCFGKDRQGNIGLLQYFAKKQNFIVHRVKAVTYNDYRVSSSQIRKFLKEADFHSAAKMLGREFSITGQVIHGDKKGRAINFPTINISIKRKISPILGVFVVIVELDNSIYKGVCNIGRRPTVYGRKVLLEVFLFDFNKQVYGRCANIIFKHKIRDEKKFSNLSELAQQIKLDVEKALLFFKTYC